MLINCIGVKGTNNKIKFQAPVVQRNPDIIFSCESKLDEGTPTYSVFFEQYEIYRKDRTANGGGIFLAVRNGIIAIDRHEFDSDAEVCWASVEFARNGFLNFCSYDRPPNFTNAALVHLQDSLDKMVTTPKTTKHGASR